MSRKASAVKIESDSESDSDTSNATGVEMEFDDDTDLPLPGPTKHVAKAALPNLGTRGALLEEIRPGQTSSSTSGMRPSAPAPAPAAGPAGMGGLLDPSHPLFQQFAAANSAAGGGRAPLVLDPNSPEMQKYKKWTCIYPIYMDAKRAYGTGQRRIAREKSVWWPRSQDILTACASFRFNVLHEPQASHPRDWENPGRVRVQWKENGRLTNPSIPTKKKLFEMIAAFIQGAKPDQVPNMAMLSIKDTEDVANPAAVAKPPPPATKARPSNTKSKHLKNTHPQQPLTKRRRPALPKPPLPLPPLQERISMYSPLIPSGSLLEGWRVGVPAAEEKGPTGAAGTTGGAAGKGKRKVIKIRM
ncbi:signal recognition particle subunit [Tulasnella sp. JGI-2019a]|nr:signal recognition particle subunit [Tulasnella sp. JGI-2019a]KAG9001698.1 signal recognition particle subunit [Tulasnella sp. JGI-2019a]KAG9030252.1 signal recognition particle subunit [Tulasnella sp. JGI-2019a]